MKVFRIAAVAAPLALGCLLLARQTDPASPAPALVKESTSAEDATRPALSVPGSARSNVRAQIRHADAQLPVPIEGLPAGATLVSVSTATAATTDPHDVPELDGERVGARQMGAPDAAYARFIEDKDRFLQETISARVRTCWKNLEGTGQIQFLFTMRAAAVTGETVVTPSVEDALGYDSPVSIVESSLTPEQNRRALDCMLDAFEGTSFMTVVPAPELGTLITIHQSWLVGPPR